MLAARILAFIDFFYPPFRKILPIRTFRYAFCGAANNVLDVILYFISYNFILHKQVLDLGFYALKPYIAAFLMSFIISFPTGFIMNRHVVFQDSQMHGRVQFFRYFFVVMICILLNYVFIRIFVERFHFYPTAAKIVTVCIVTTFSYLTQKNFAFKTTDPKQA